MVSEKTRKGAAPVIMVAPSAPPPRSTPLQDQIVQKQFSTDSVSSPTPGQVGGRERGWSSSEESSSPQFPNVQQIVLRMSNPKDSPEGIPDVGNRPSTAHDVVDQKTCDDQIVAQGHVRDPSDICETSFDDITSSTFHPEGDEADKTEATPPSPPPSVSTPEIKRDVELHGVKTKHKVAPPVPLRKSSTRTSTHLNSEELTVDSSPATSKAQTHSELKHLPSLKDRKEQLQAKMTDSNPPYPQSSEHVEPGKLVIHEALKGVSPGMPAAQHPLLQKKREDTATKERKEEQGKLSREEKEKAKKRFSFVGPKTKKGKEADLLTNSESRTDPTPSKEQRRRSMPVSEQDELHTMFKHITLNRLSNPDPLPQTHTETTVRENKDEEQEGLVRDEAETEKEETDNPGFSLQPSQPAPNSPPSPPQEPPTKLTIPLNQLKSLPEHPMERELASLSSSRPSTLERCTPKPPSSSPPSLPGSIDRRTRRQGNSQNNTLERQSRPGSRPGTLERKTPPPPTSQPPPVPTEIRKENTKSARPLVTSSIGFNGGRMNLVDVIVGVDRDALMKTVAQPPSITTASSSTPHQSGPINVKRKSIKKRH